MTDLDYFKAVRSVNTDFDIEDVEDNRPPLTQAIDKVDHNTARLTKVIELLSEKLSSLRVDTSIKKYDDRDMPSNSIVSQHSTVSQHSEVVSRIFHQSYELDQLCSRLAQLTDDLEI